MTQFRPTRSLCGILLTESRALYTGGLGNWLILKLARNNQGVMQSEHRLWLFAPSVILVPGGLILWGVGAAHHIKWVGLMFGMGLLGFTTSVAVQLSVSYCIDSYPELSGEALVTVILIRNTMSFAINYRLVMKCPQQPGYILTRLTVSRHGSPTWDYRMHSSSRRLLG